MPDLMESKFPPEQLLGYLLGRHTTKEFEVMAFIVRMFVMSSIMVLLRRGCIVEGLYWHVHCLAFESASY
jgi:hypothetical protein